MPFQDVGTLSVHLLYPDYFPISASHTGKNGRKKKKGRTMSPPFPFGLRVGCAHEDLKAEGDVELTAGGIVSAGKRRY